MICSVLFAIYKYIRPEIVEQNGKFYVRRWALLCWSYLDNGVGLDEDFWWTFPTYVEKYSFFNSEQEARFHYFKVKEKYKRKFKKIGVIK